MSEIQRRPCGLVTALSPVSSSHCVPRRSGSPMNAVSTGYASIVAGDQHQEASSREVNSLSSASSRIAASSRSRVLDGVVAVIERHQRSDAGTTQLVTSYTPKPGPVLLAPVCLPGEHIPVAQSELSQTLTGTHQVTSGIVTAADEVTGCFWLRLAIRTGTMAPARSRRASSIASLRSLLTPVPGRVDQLRGCRDLHPMPRLVKSAGQTEPGTAARSGDSYRVRPLGTRPTS